MVLEKGLAIRSLPKTLREDFKQLDRLEGRFKVTGYLVEDVDLKDSNPRNGPSCGFCDAKEEAERKRMITEDYKPTAVFSKVILISIYKVKTRIDVAQGGGGVGDVQDGGGQVGRVHGERVHCWPT